MSAASRVNRGVKYLDKHEPGWAEKVVRPINLCSQTNCVLGQVDGDFFDYLDKKFTWLAWLPPYHYVVSGVWSILHGFDGHEGMGVIDEATELWRVAVEDRQSEAEWRRIGEFLDESRCQSAAARIREYEASLNKEKVSA